MGTDILTERGLYRLTAWLSPAFPVGAYAYSHGLEYAVEAGLVADRETLTDWIAAVVEDGAGRSDAILFAHAWRAAAEGDGAKLAEVAELADALRGTAEMALEARAQGAAFAETVRRAWPDAALRARSARQDAFAPDDRPYAYPVAVAVAAARARIPLSPALAAFLQSVAANLVSAGVRLIPLGQTDGQRTLAALEPAVLAAAETALVRSLDDVGSATPMVDWTSTLHETQYTRLFRS